MFFYEMIYQIQIMADLKKICIFPPRNEKIYLPFV